MGTFKIVDTIKAKEGLVLVSRYVEDYKKFVGTNIKHGNISYKIKDIVQFKKPFDDGYPADIGILVETKK